MVIGAITSGVSSLWNKARSLPQKISNLISGKTRPVAMHAPIGFKDKCGVFGIFSGDSFKIGESFYTGLNTIQNRGQCGCGVAYSSYDEITPWKTKISDEESGRTLVNDLFYGGVEKTMKGHFGIGHTLYTTSKTKDNEKTVHPILVGEGEDQMALVHNGNIPDTQAMKDFLVEKKVFNREELKDMNDSTLMAHTIHYFFKETNNLESAIKQASPYFNGAYALLVMSKTQLAALRDPAGIRPLNLAKDQRGRILLSSETHTFDALNSQFIREIQPGELLMINRSSLNTNFKQTPPTVIFKNKSLQNKLDAFEHIYFARPQSKLHGRYISEMRRDAGKKLADIFKAQHKDVTLDLVIPVPESGIPAATGFAEEMKLPLNPALVKNSHKRTFIDGGKREQIRAKFSLIKDAIKGKHIALVDDSIVRGNTSKYLLEYINEAKPASVHFLSASPPVLFPDFYGIDLAKQEDLIAYDKKKKHGEGFEKEVAKEIGANTVTYTDIDSFTKSLGIKKAQERVELSKFTGKYSIDLGKRKQEVDFSVAA